MKTSFVLVLATIFAVAFGAPCNKKNHGSNEPGHHHGDITQVQTAGSGNNNSGVGGLLGLSALNGDINILGKQEKNSVTSMTQNANA